MFCYENALTFPIYNSDQKSENSIDFLRLLDENKSHLMHTLNILTDSCFTKQKVKTTNT